MDFIYRKDRGTVFFCHLPLDMYHNGKRRRGVEVYIFAKGDDGKSEHAALGGDALRRTSVIL